MDATRCGCWLQPCDCKRPLTGADSRNFHAGTKPVLGRGVEKKTICYNELRNQSIAFVQITEYRWKRRRLWEETRDFFAELLRLKRFWSENNCLFVFENTSDDFLLLKTKDQGLFLLKTSSTNTYFPTIVLTFSRHVVWYCTAGVTDENLSI